MISVKGTASKLEMEILGGIIEPDCPNIEFKNVTFDCKSIKDAAGHIFINQTYCNESDKKEAKDDNPCWIPCEERLPEEYGLYIATMNDGSVQECSYVPTDYGDVLLNGWSTCEASGFKVLNENDVLAWMPLPEPYRAERRDDE